MSRLQSLHKILSSPKELMLGALTLGKVTRKFKLKKKIKQDLFGDLISIGQTG